MTENRHYIAYLSLFPLMMTSILIMCPYICLIAGIEYPEQLNTENSTYILFGFLALQLIINYNFVLSGLDAMFSRHSNADSLVLIGIAGSVGMAISHIGTPSVYPLTVELFIFNAIALLTIDAFSSCTLELDNAMPITIDRIHHIAIWYVPTILIISLLAFGWGVVTDADINFAYFFLILVSACPASIKLVYPMLLLKLMKLCKENGIIIQKPEALELLPQVDVLACSLYGTLTKGDPYVRDTASQGILLEKMLILAATAETYMDNSIAWAIVKNARERKLVLGKATGTNVLPNLGIEVMHNHMVVRVGSGRLMKLQRVELNASMRTKADQMAGKGMVPLFVNTGNYCRGIIGVLDDYIPDAPIAVEALDDMSVETILLTGKDNNTAHYYERQLNLSQAIGNLTPEEKAKEIQVRKAQGQTVAAIGCSPTFKDALDTADISFVPQSAPPDLRKDAHVLLETSNIGAIATAVSLGLSWQSKLIHCICVTFLANVIMLGFSSYLILEGTAGEFHPLIPLISTVVSIIGLIICTNTLKVE